MAEVYAKLMFLRVDKKDAEQERKNKNPEGIGANTGSLSISAQKLIRSLLNAGRFIESLEI